MLEIRFPKILMKIFGFFGIVNLNIMDLFHSGCWVSSSFYTRLVITSLIPFITIGIGGGVLLLFQRELRVKKDPFYDVKFQASLSVFKALSLAFTYVIFPAIGSVV